ncbi:Wzz/FepE/Etk N-terminal domain-containing protein [Halomonas sp. NCCP-2165]|nr:Wzz/FepE/Etk N-terminal domain-containing protein [Halomonas sp. NCCP-2165]GKW49719.1 hypothetical protein NCCP2165_19340 [Halomonas sp. NCCP-2165]
MSTPEYAPNRNDDEIDLRDLALMLIEGWYWIVGSVAVAVIAAFSYLAITPSTYETSFRAMPAPDSHFADINRLLPAAGFVEREQREQEAEGEAINYPVSWIVSEDLYQDLVNRLSSYSNFERFLEGSEEGFTSNISQYGDLRRLFSERMSVSGLNADRNGNYRMAVTYRYHEGEPGAELLNAYVNDTAEALWSERIQILVGEIEAEVARLESLLDYQVAQLQSERMQQLFELEQAIAIARRLGIDEPVITQQLSPPEYYRGLQALEVEHAVLRASLDQQLRSSDILRIERELAQYQDALLQIETGVGLESAGNEHNSPVERLVDVAEYAYSPVAASEPRKALILALSLVLGGMLGVMLVFLSHFAASLRSYRHEKSA